MPHGLGLLYLLYSESRDRVYKYIDIYKIYIYKYIIDIYKDI